MNGLVLVLAIIVILLRFYVFSQHRQVQDLEQKVEGLERALQYSQQRPGSGSPLWWVLGVFFLFMLLASII